MVAVKTRGHVGVGDGRGGGGRGGGGVSPKTMTLNTFRMQLLR